jgi:fermentation-respiration switch protein FrsA (DUF1100 family)
MPDRGPGRRTVAVVLAALTAATPVACSTGDGAPPPAAASRPAAASVAPRPTTPSSASPTAGKPASSTRVEPASGRAPAGPFAVGVRHVKLRRGVDRPLPTTVWYPATGRPGPGVSEGSTVAPGPFPLILFSHGLTTVPDDYRTIVTRWVAAGFVVAAPAYPHTSRGVRDYDPVDLINQPADASRVITAVLALNSRPGDPLHGRINAGRIAAAGHSGGGITTVGLFTGNRDERLDAGIVLAGQRLLKAPFTGPPAPMLFVHGKQDTTVAYAAGLATFRAVPWPRAMLTVTAGGHVTTPRDFGVTVGTTTEFLRWSLYGDRAAKARIAREARRGGIAELTDKL